MLQITFVTVYASFGAHLQLLKVVDQRQHIAFFRPAEVSGTFLHQTNTLLGHR